MKPISPFLLTGALLLTMACGGDKKTSVGEDAIVSSQQVHEGDSTLYGLACDGCTDTILVFLRDVNSDPDTLNILEATRQHNIFGRPGIGDKIAVVRNSQDSTIADIVINMETLRGAWAYKVKPTLRQRPGMPGQSEVSHLRGIPDSIRDSLMKPREYGFLIRGEGTVSSIGRNYRNNDDDDSPVEFPKPKRYHQWHLFNGALILTETMLDSLGQERPTGSDTAHFVMLSPDTLVLRFSNEVKSFYRSK